MRSPYRVIVCVVLVSILAAGFPRALVSQWKRIALLPTNFATVYFLDKQGLPKVGFVGCHTDIMRTTDGGYSWKSVQNTLGAYVRDFIFWDAMNGIGVCSSAPLFFRTTDGGLTWDYSPSPGPATSISYAKATGILTVNSIQPFGACKFSTDSGQTWQPSPVPEDQNGMTFFPDGLHGVFAAHNAVGPYYWTTDGALTWKVTTFHDHVYSPIAADDQPGVFISVGELSRQCWLSRDYGQTWIQRSLFPPGVTPNGCTRYHNGKIWVQSQERGFFLSTDMGLSWRSICGPSRIADMRFYSIDSTLYADDGSGGFWTIDDGTVAALPSQTSFAPSPLLLNASACGEGRGTFTVATTACYEVLDTVTIKGPATIRMNPPIINTQTAISGRMSLQLIYTPTPNRYYDTAYIHVAWGADGHFRDTTIAVYAQVISGATASVLTFNNLQHPSCDPFDTAFSLRSMSCDTAQVLQCNLIDSSIFRLYVIPPLPFKLYTFHNFQFGLHASALPAGTYTAYVHMRILGATGTIDTIYPITLTVAGAPSPIAGPAHFDPSVLCDSPDSLMWIHNPYCGAITLEKVRSSSPFLVVRDSTYPLTIRGFDSIPVHMTLAAKDGHFVWLLFCEFKVAGQTIDTILYVISDGSILHLAMPMLSASPRTICDVVDTIVWIYAPKCLGARVDWLHLTGDRVTLLDTAFPVMLNAGDSMPVHLRILPSHTPVTATLFAQFVEDSITLDTSYTLTVKIQKPTKPTPKLDPVPLRFGYTPWCTGKSLPLHIFNNKCQAMKVVKIAWVVSDTEIWYDTVPLPITIQPGTMDSILLRYKPSALKQANAQLRITFDLADLTQDTVILVTGIGIDTGVAIIEPAVLAFDTISKCDERSDTAIFNNVSCDTMILESFADWQKNGYEVISPSLPITVQPGQTVPIVVRLKRKSDGSAIDSLDFAYYSTKPPHSPLSVRLKLFGTIQTLLWPLQMDSASFSSVHLVPCMGFDSFIVVRNTNICDSLTVSSLAGNGIAAATQLPLILQPGEQDTIRFHYAPSRDTDVTQLRVQGTLLDTTLSLVTYRMNAGEVTCTPTTLAPFIAPMCHIASDSLLLNPGGCDSAIIDKLEIIPNSSFKIVQQYTTPFALSESSRVTISYDPSRGESDTASLYLHSSSGALNLRIPLRGITTTLQTARIGIRDQTNTLATNVAVPDHTTFTLFTEDNIPDSLGLSEIDCDLALNSNILTLKNVQPGTHLSAVSFSQSGNTTSIVLKRTDASSLPVNSLLATLDFSSALSDTIATDVSIAKVRFNPEEADYERCVLAALADASGISVTIDPSCTRDLMTGVMAGKGILTSIRVHPSVLTGSDEIVLDLDATKETTAIVRVVNELGIEECHLQIPVQAGFSSHTLPFCSPSSGLKFVQISAEGTLTTQRVIVIQ